MGILKDSGNTNLMMKIMLDLKWRLSFHLGQDLGLIQIISINSIHLLSKELAKEVAF